MNTLFRRKTLSKKPHITFKSTTHVKNQYNTIAPDGSLNTYINEYNVPATNDNSSSKRPSKSSLRQAFVKAKEEGYNIGWQGAMSYADSNNSTTKDRSAAHRDRAYMKNRYGDAWINAEIQRESAKETLEPLKKKALEEFLQKMRILEEDFLKYNGIEAPTVLEREAEMKLKKLYNNNSINYGTILAKKREIFQDKRNILSKIPIYILNTFQNNVVRLKYELDRKYAEVDESERHIMSSAVGKPYPKRVYRTLKNRLVNAEKIRKSETPKKKWWIF